MQERSYPTDSGDRASDDPLLRAAHFPLLTVPLQSYHDLEAFECPSNPEIQAFARTEAWDYAAQHRGLIFVLQSSTKKSRVEGFYSFSYSTIYADMDTQGTDQTASVIPVVVIGYVGRDHRSSPGVGTALIIDAAKRGYRLGGRSQGLAFYAANQRLADFYSEMGFVPARREVESPHEFERSRRNWGSHYMFASYEQLIVPIDRFKLPSRPKDEITFRFSIRWLANFITKRTVKSVRDGWL